MSILIDADTTFIVQGITGREAVNLTRECLDYGTGAKVVGGVTPGAGNLLSGNRLYGLAFCSTGTERNVAHGNFIGTNAAGTTGVPAICQTSTDPTIVARCKQSDGVAILGRHHLYRCSGQARRGETPLQGSDDGR